MTITQATIRNVAQVSFHQGAAGVHIRLLVLLFVWLGSESVLSPSTEAVSAQACGGDCTGHDGQDSSDHGGRYRGVALLGRSQQPWMGRIGVGGTMALMRPSRLGEIIVGGVYNLFVYNLLVLPSALRSWHP